MRSRLIMGMLLLSSSAFAADCTYRQDALGRQQYHCDDGRKGALRQDALGRIRDSGTEQTWRQDATGTWRSNDGQIRREDALGRTRQSDGTVWHTDALGQQKASDGTQCRTDTLGRTRCQGGESQPPSVWPKTEE